MKSLFVLAALLIAAVSARAYSFSENFERTYPLSGDGVVTVSNVNGDVTIATWDRNEVRIEADKSAKTREELQQIELVVDSKLSHLAIKVHLPKRSATNRNTIRANVVFTITVPATANLRDIGTANGSITVEGVRGRVRAHSVNGRIFAADLGGDTELETVNGTIKASFASVADAQQIRAETVNGTCTLELPADLSASIEAGCVNGLVSCDLPAAFTKKHRKHLRGTIGAGSASIKASTVNGLVRLRKL